MKNALIDFKGFFTSKKNTSKLEVVEVK